MATLLKTVFSALLLLALLVWVKFRFEHHLAPATSGIQAELRGPKTEILLLGSSHTRQGYDAALLEKITGKRAFVIGYDGVDLVSMLPLMKTVLADPARRPALLVIEANGGNFAREPEIEEPRFFFDAPPAMKRQLVRDYLRTHHDRSAYVDMWTLVANRGGELILTWPLVHGAINSLSYHGSYENKTVGGVPPAWFAAFRVPVQSSVPNPDQVDALHEIVTLAVADGVKLIFAEPPMPAPVETEPEMMALQQSFRTITEQINVPYYQGAEGFPVNDPGMFSDSNHLSTAGRELYTRRFAEVVSENLR